jgi:hypothetical protein
MTRMTIAPASLALALALGACGSSGSDKTTNAATDGAAATKPHKPKPFPRVEKLTGDAKRQALDGSIKRSLAWANAYYGTTVIDNSVYNACADRKPNVWSCSIQIKVVKPFAGHQAGPIPGGYTVTLDPKAKQLTFASGTS